MPFSFDGILDRNPEYGSGVFRRRIRLTKTATSVVAELEDCSHAMRLTLHHHNGVISGIEGEVLRAPVNTCAEAPTRLQEFVGHALNGSNDVWIKQIDPSQQCTHLHDIALMAISHAQGDDPVRQLDIAITDEANSVMNAEILLNGAAIHRWQVKNREIIAPEKLKGKPLFKGFIPWVREELSSEEQVCALAMQRGLLVSNARRWDMPSVYGKPADTFGPGKNICYSYSETRIHSAWRSVDSVRDFTDTPEQLLKFK
jgi:hypothetical protein